MNLSTSPKAFCEECQRARDPFQHMRAELPSTAAMDWLSRTCPKASEEERRKRRGSAKARPCPIKYTAGIIIDRKVLP